MACRYQLDTSLRRNIIHFREQASIGSEAQLAVLKKKTEDDTQRFMAVILSWCRYNNALQLFVNRILRDAWLERRNRRSFRPYRDLTYIL